MSEQDSQDSVKITASPYASPPIRAIARACIALARWQKVAATHPDAVDKPTISTENGTKEAHDD